jgi:aldehyde:ferredoxin oxidoreductase
MKWLWGRDVQREELEQLGERIWNLGRLFNLRERVEHLPRAEPHARHPRLG